MSSATPRMKTWDHFEIQTKVVFLKTAADLPTLPTQAELKIMVDFVDDIKRPKQGRNDMPWVMYEGKAADSTLSGQTLPKPTASGHCFETKIPLTITNKTPRLSPIHISQEMAPCAGCMNSYAGWAKSVDRPIVVYGEDASGKVPKQSFVIFTASGATYVLERALRKTVLG